MLKSMTVTMDDASWRTAHSVLVEASVRLAAEGDERLAREVMDKIAPILAIAARSETLEQLERRAREEIGLPEILDSKRREAEESVRIGSPREGLRPVRARRAG